jgi:hypothetical protein
VGQRSVSAVWQCGSVAAWQRGSVAAWQCGSVAVWQCNSVAAWQCGSVAVWQCGSVAAWQAPVGTQLVAIGSASAEIPVKRFHKSGMTNHVCDALPLGLAKTIHTYVCAVYTRYF